MKVKLFDEEHELDLEKSMNDFLNEMEGNVIDIKYCTSCFMGEKDQIYSFSAMIIYE